MEQKSRKRTKEARGHNGTEEQKEVDKAYIEESFYNKILRVLEKHSGKCLDTAKERATVARAVARRLADTAIDEEFAAFVKPQAGVELRDPENMP